MNKTHLMSILVGMTLLTTLATITLSDAEATKNPISCKKGTYTVLESASAEQKGNSALKLSVDTGCDIPKFPDKFINSQIVFGYAWLDNNKVTLTGVLAAIHPTFDDSNQNPNAWHTHTVVLERTKSQISDFCIADLGTSQGGISLHNDVMNLNIAENQAGINADDLNLAASFTVVQDKICRSTGLGVSVISTTGL